MAQDEADLVSIHSHIRKALTHEHNERQQIGEFYLNHLVDLHLYTSRHAVSSIGDGLNGTCDFNM